MQDGPNRTDKPEPGTTQTRGKCLQATLGYTVLHIARSMRPMGIRKWKAGCPCSQVPDGRPDDRTQRRSDMEFWKETDSHEQRDIQLSALFRRTQRLFRKSCG